jgi:hypothetical protein
MLQVSFLYGRVCLSADAANHGEQGQYQKNHSSLLGNYKERFCRENRLNS